MAKKVAVIAIGGNSLIKDPKHQSVEDQYFAATETCIHIADMIEAGYEVVIGHGNGPQVGFILRRSEIAAKHLNWQADETVVSRKSPEERQRLRIEQWNQVNADPDRGSARRLARGDCLASI